MLAVGSWRAKVFGFVAHIPGLQIGTHVYLQGQVIKTKTEVKKYERKELLSEVMIVSQQSILTKLQKAKVQDVVNIENCAKKLEDLVKTHGNESLEVKKVEEEMKNLNEVNQNRMEKIIATEKNMSDAKEFAVKRDLAEQKLLELESKLQEFKAKESYGESFPQFVLQMTIILKVGIFQWYQNQADFLVISSIISSFASLMLTIANATISLPLYIYGKKQIQFKSMKFQFGIILPLVTVVVAPRLLSLCLFFSLFALENAWICIAILSFFLMTYLIGYWIILKISFVKQKKKDGSASVIRTQDSQDSNSNNCYQRLFLCLLFLATT